MNIVLVFLIKSLLLEPAHEFKLGRFEIRPKDDYVSLLVRLDRLDLLEAMQSNCKDYNYLDQCFTEYITGHFKLSFDGEEVKIEHLESLYQENFIELYFKLEANPIGIKQIKVFNNVFLEFWDRQENIVYSMLNDRKRSFRLNKDRTETLITY